MIRQSHIVLVCVFCAVVAGVCAFQQWRTTTALEKRLAILTAEAQSKDAAVRKQREVAAPARDSSQPAAKGPLNPESSPQALAETIRQLYGNIPKTAEELVAARQTQTKLVQEVYTEFINSRKLREDQAAVLPNLLINKGLAQSEDGDNFMAGDGENGENAARNAQAAVERIKQIDSEIKSLLGGAAYAAFLEYNKTVGERVALSRIKQGFAATETSLGDEEAKALLQIMMEERAKTQPSPLAQADVSPREQFRAFLNSANQEELFQNETDLQQRILERAAGMLKPEQVAVLQMSLRRSLEMDRLVMETARLVAQGRKKDASEPAQ